jgi:acetyl esterase
MDDILDPELAAVAPALPAVDLSDLQSARSLARTFAGMAPKYESGRALDVVDLTVPGYDGAPGVPVRVYAPAARPATIPGLIYLRGGGWVTGELDSVDSHARLIADRAEVAVVSVDYRLAPEHPYPAALFDAFAVLLWASGEAGAAHGIDAERIGLWGESSGGGIAAGVALLAKDRGGPLPAAQFLDAPAVDDRLQTYSMRYLTDAPFWKAANSVYGWDYYLRGIAEPGSHDVPTYAAASRARVQDLAGLPPTWIAAYQVDPIRDEVLAYAQLLIRAGVPTDVNHYSGAFHVAHVVPGTAIGARIIDDQVDAVRRLLHVPATADQAVPT